MSIEGDIISTLDGHAPLIALVSTRNYWRRLPQEPTYPHTVVQRINTEPHNTLTTRNPLTRMPARVMVYGQNPASVRQVADAVRGAMEAATLFTALWIDEQDDPFNNTINADIIAIDFSVWYQT